MRLVLDLSFDVSLSISIIEGTPDVEGNKRIDEYLMSCKFLPSFLNIQLEEKDRIKRFK